MNAIAGSYFNLDVFKTIYPVKPGSVTKPMPGHQVHILDEENKQVPPNQLGKIVIKLPMPPGSMLTLWGNHQAYMKKYLSESPGYFSTGDAGFFDERGYLHIMARIDDVINTAGHRISTGHLEQVVSDHPSVAECAIIGLNDNLKG